MFRTIADFRDAWVEESDATLNYEEWAAYNMPPQP